MLGKDAELIFKGQAPQSRGVSSHFQKGTIISGQSLYSNRNMSTLCAQKVVFGDDALIDWNVSIRDCDGHKVYVDGACS